MIAGALAFHFVINAVVSSLNGTDFDVKPSEPGRFRFGIAITPQGTWLDAAVATPRHPEPASQAPVAPSATGEAAP